MSHKRNNSNNLHTPSPLTHPPRTRAVSGGSTKSSPGLSRSQNQSPSTFKKPKGKLNSSSAKSVKSDNLQIDIESPAESPLCRSLWNQHKCPCNRNIDCWQIDCSKCGQYWHIECVTLDGLGETEINKLMKWKCPLCYVAPISTSENSDCCMTCRNTRTLRDAHNQFEASAIASKIKSLSNLIPDQNTDLTDSSSLSHQNTLSCIESDLKQFTEKCEKAFNDVAHGMSKLEAEIHKISSLSPSAAPTPNTNSAIESHNALLESIAQQIEAISSNSPHHPPASTPPQLTQPHNSPPLPVHQEHSTPTNVDHHQKTVEGYIRNFVDETTAANISTFLQSSTFSDKNGRSTLSFGAPYSYVGSKGDRGETEFPDVLKPIVDKINELQKGIYYEHHPKLKAFEHLYPAPVINSCLVNKFDGPESFLPRHSDNEATVHPESSIFTISVGESCTIKFSDTGAESAPGSESSSELSCDHLSLYHMTRKSQDFFQHAIERGSITQGTRYSLTFRSVSWKNKNATCLIGDSNTGLLRFGTCKRRTFGELMPGQKVWAPVIGDIRPESCVSYSNAVILCGINDLKQPHVTCESDVNNLCCKLINKVKQIKQLNSKCFVYVCPLLPTKIADLNQRVNCFNLILFNSLASMGPGVQCVQGFQGFAEHDGMLVHQLSKTLDRYNQPDTLHLNESGVRVLAGLIKRAIFSRLHKGVDRRSGPANRVNGRPFSSLFRGPPAPPASQWGGRGGYQVR